jgi:hypothetical protein
LLDHPPYSPELAPSDYHLLTYLKNWLGSQCFNNNELMEGVKTWLSSQAADFFDNGIQKRIPRYNKGLNAGGDYIEKWLKCTCVFLYIINIFLIASFVNSSLEVTFRKAPYSDTTTIAKIIIRSTTQTNDEKLIIKQKFPTDKTG